jgi:hypothetical protein
MSHSSFRPSEEQHFIQIDGKILLMAFLPSPEADTTKVILLLLVFQSNETRQYLYKWDVRRPLQTIKCMACSARRLKEDQVPTMLIPSTSAFSYMVVMSTGITYYENVQSSEMKRVNCQFAQESQETLEWVQWSRPRRHHQYLQRHDDIVILREDGLLRNFLIEKNSSTKFSTNNTIGHLEFSVDTAFAMLSGPPGKGGDVLLVGGSLTDGGVYHVSARRPPECIQSISTLAPLNDMTPGPSVGIGSAPLNSRTSRCLYACSGPQDGKGMISEIHYGLEAQIGWKMEFPDASMIDQLFSLEISATKELLLLASQTTNSSMVVFELETQDISFTDSKTHPGFDFDHPTLAAAVVDQDIVVQVTTAGVRALSIRGDGTIRLMQRLNSVVGLAAFSDSQDNIVLSCQGAVSRELSLLDVGSKPNGPPDSCFVVSKSVPLDYVPNSVCCSHTSNGLLVMVGTAFGEILGYDAKLECLFRCNVHDLVPAQTNEPISSLLALSHGRDGPTLLLCGLRSGIMLCVDVKKQGRNISEFCMENYPQV